MPTLAPEHVAAHLPEVSFVCRGAGEYFLPRLVRILGNQTVDEPFSAAQQAALLEMDGLLAIDRSQGEARTLLCGRSARTVQVDDLDRVELDLTHLKPHHIEGGVELSTSLSLIHI